MTQLLIGSFKVTGRANDQWKQNIFSLIEMMCKMAVSIKTNSAATSRVDNKAEIINVSSFHLQRNCPNQLYMHSQLSFFDDSVRNFTLKDISIQNFQQFWKSLKLFLNIVLPMFAIFVHCMQWNATISNLAADFVYTKMTTR